MCLFAFDNVLKSNQLRERRLELATWKSLYSCMKASFSESATQHLILAANGSHAGMPCCLNSLGGKRSCLDVLFLVSHVLSDRTGGQEGGR